MVIRGITKIGDDKIAVVLAHDIRIINLNGGLLQNVMRSVFSLKANMCSSVFSKNTIGVKKMKNLSF